MNEWWWRTWRAERLPVAEKNWGSSDHLGNIRAPGCNFTEWSGYKDGEELRDRQNKDVSKQSPPCRLENKTASRSSLDRCPRQRVQAKISCLAVLHKYTIFYVDLCLATLHLPSLSGLLLYKTMNPLQPGCTVSNMYKWYERTRCQEILADFSTCQYQAFAADLCTSKVLCWTGEQKTLFLCSRKDILRGDSRIAALIVAACSSNFVTLVLICCFCRL